PHRPHPPSRPSSRSVLDSASAEQRERRQFRTPRLRDHSGLSLPESWIRTAIDHLAHSPEAPSRRGRAGPATLRLRCPAATAEPEKRQTQQPVPRVPKVCHVLARLYENQKQVKSRVEQPRVATTQIS